MLYCQELPRRRRNSSQTPKSWSILEVVCHLYDEEREDFREHLDFILHRQNEEYHVIDPQGWVTERKYNEQNFAEMQEKFFAERQKSSGMAQRNIQIQTGKPPTHPNMAL